jgi:isoaspartyl peptidase/L-asparaginase-like protein (Ntn-hydrolase superfamily)
MSAAIMDGATENDGVINIEEVKPVQVAQILMQYDRILGGSGATHFAKEWF